MRTERLSKWARLAAVAVLTAGCQRESERASGTVEPANEQAARPPLPIAEPPVDRAALLRAVAEAASQAGLGRQDAEMQRGLDGKRFEVRIRFGCASTAASGATASAPFSVRFDRQKRLLRVRAAPDLTLDDAGVAAIAGQGVEAVEGFWMYRPWLLTDGCPPPARQPAAAEGDGSETAATAVAPPSPAPAYRHRVGLAQFFTGADSRTGRRDDRAYEATKVLGEDEQPSAQGYNLVLSGRLRKLPDGRAISCRPAEASVPPECIVSAAFDRVWIETPGTGAVLAEWGN